MNNRAFLSSRLQPGPAGAWLLALVLVFWAAQLHGLVHGIGHLARDHGAPHALVCADCIASADAGAAPPMAIAPLVLLSGAAADYREPDGQPADGRTLAAYRSRAPPPTTT